MRTASKSVYSHWEGILAWYDKSINNGFAEVVDNTQTTRRIARGLRNIDYFITMVYLCNGRLEVSFDGVAVPIVKQVFDGGMLRIPKPSAASLQQFRFA